MALHVAELWGRKKKEMKKRKGKQKVRKQGKEMKSAIGKCN